MLNLEIYNFNEIEPVYQAEIKRSVQDKKDYYEQLFKKYDKDLILKVGLNKDNEYRVSIEINMKSKDLQVVKTGKDLLKIWSEAWKDFKKAVKKQIQLERKDYLYKRKRYRRQKWQAWLPELKSEVEAEKAQTQTVKGKRKVKAVMKAVQKYLKTRLKSLGFTKKQIKAQLPELTELIERKFYEKFDPKSSHAVDMESLLFGVAEEVLSGYRNSLVEVAGELDIEEFEGDNDAPKEIFDSENIMLEDITEAGDVIDGVYENLNDKQIDETLQTVIDSQDSETRAAVQMYYLEQFNEDEIAMVLGKNAESIRQQLQDFKQEVESAFRRKIQKP